MKTRLLCICVLSSACLFAQANKPVQLCGSSKASVYMTAAGTSNIVSPISEVAPHATGNIRICDMTLAGPTSPTTVSILALTPSTATGTTGTNSVTLSAPLTKLKTGRFMLFGTDATVYTVTAISGSVLTVSPNLASSPSAAAAYIDWFPAILMSDFSKYWGGDFDIGQGYTLALNLAASVTVSGLITYYIDTNSTQ